jgi:hypothetical protein
VYPKHTDRIDGGQLLFQRPVRGVRGACVMSRRWY